MEEGEDLSRRLWFIVDELASLNKVDALPTALAEFRKYGGCIVAGLQDTSQLLNSYGPNNTRTMLGLFNTKITFRLGDNKTAKEFSGIYGEHELKEKNEGVTFGANDMRDGVSFNEYRHFKPIIPASDFQTLNNLEAFVKLPGDLPLTKLVFRYKKFNILSPAYCEIPGLDNVLSFEKEDFPKKEELAKDLDNVVPFEKAESSLSPLETTDFEKGVDEILKENDGRTIS